MLGLGTGRWRKGISRWRKGGRRICRRQRALFVVLLFFFFFVIRLREEGHHSRANRGGEGALPETSGGVRTCTPGKQGLWGVAGKDFFGRNEKVLEETLAHDPHHKLRGGPFDMIDCQALGTEEDDRNGCDNGVRFAHENFGVKLRTARRHQRRSRDGGQAEEELERSYEGVYPILEIIPPSSCVSYVPKEVFSDEEGEQHGPPQSVKRVVSREKNQQDDVVVWRTFPKAPSTLRCVSRRNAINATAFTMGGVRHSHLFWNSGGFPVRITMVGNLSGLDQDAVSATFSFNSENQVRFYGLPSRATGLQVPGNISYRAFNQFELLHEVSPASVMGGTVPFVYAIGKVLHTGDNRTSTNWRRHAVGIFWLNGSPLRVHTNSTEKTGSTSISFTSTGGSTRIFLLPGPTPEDVLLQYYTLTGFPMMPPLFSLGYHHGHKGYMNESSILELSATFAKENIPVDTLSIGLHHTKNGRIFTWDETLFPDPIGLQKQLWRDGGRFLVLSTVSYVSVDLRYPVYVEGRENGFFVRMGVEEEGPYIGRSRYGMSAWIDFLSEEVRLWYGGLMKYKRFLGSTNHTFFSLEENQPIVSGDGGSVEGIRETLPMLAGHVDDVPHLNIHNLYGMLHAMANFNGQLRRTLFHRRPFVITESFFSGTQRHAAVRLGRNTASWKHLRASVEQCLMHSIAGIPFVGNDVGGFFRDPDDELLVRWYQLAAFYPLFRSEASSESSFCEAWRRPAYVRVRIRDAVQFRYTLLPYLYTLFWHAHLHGELVLRPLFIVYHHDTFVELAPEMQTKQFFLGPHLFVAPVVDPAGPGDAAYALQMPPEEFYNFWTGELVAPRQTVQLSRKISSSLLPEKNIVPLFQRVGTILPTFTNVDKMRSTHDVANYTLTIAFPPLLSRLLPKGRAATEGGNRGIRQVGNDTEILARGEMFLDDGSRYVNYHGSHSTGHASCFLEFECVLLPGESTVVVRWHTPISSSSSCQEAVSELQSGSLGVLGSKAFVLSRLRLLFATPDESRHLKRAGRVTGAHRDDFVLFRSSDNIVEVHGLAVPFLNSDEDTIDSDKSDDNYRGVRVEGGGKTLRKNHSSFQLVATLYFG